MNDSRMVEQQENETSILILMTDSIIGLAL